MEHIEHGDRAVETAHGGMREDLAVDQLAADDNLRAVRRDEVHEVGHGRELLGKRVEATPRRRDEVDSAAAKPADKLERFRRDVALRVEQRAVHVACDKLDHAGSPSCRPLRQPVLFAFPTPAL